MSSIAAMWRARPGRTSQAQAPARPGTPHHRFSSTSGSGRAASHAHAGRARARPASAFRCSSVSSPRAAPARECVGQGRAAQHSGTAQSTPFRRLHGVARSAPPSRYVVHNLRSSRFTRRLGAPVTASPGLSNARLFVCSGWPAVLRKSALRVHQSERWSAVTKNTPRFASCWRPRLRAVVPALSSTAPMCRVALTRRQLAKVPGCAPRHIGACWFTTPHSRIDRRLRRAMLR